MVGRPPLPIGTFGKITYIPQASGAIQARAKFRDFDGRVRLVTKVGPSQAAAERALKAVLNERRAPSADGQVSADTRVKDLADLWLASGERWSTGLFCSAGPVLRSTPLGLVALGAKVCRARPVRS